MNEHEFICCNNSSLSKYGNYYVCDKCKKKYKIYSMTIEGKDVESFFILKKSQINKIKVRKMTKEKFFVGFNKNDFVVYELDKDDFVLISSFEVHKKSIEYFVNGNLCMVKTADKIYQLYNMSNGELLNKKKLKINIIDSLFDNAWIGIEGMKLCIFDNEFDIKEVIIDINNKLDCGEQFKVIGVNNCKEENSFYLHMRYTPIGESIIKVASIMIKKGDKHLLYEIIKWDKNYNAITFSEFLKGYVALKKDELFLVKKDGSSKFLFKTPISHALLDGDGISYLEHFEEYPINVIAEKGYVILLFHSNIAVFNENGELRYYHLGRGNLIQSCGIIDKKRIFFGCGLLSYMVKLD